MDSVRCGFPTWRLPGACLGSWNCTGDNVALHRTNIVTTHDSAALHPLSILSHFVILGPSKCPLAVAYCPTQPIQQSTDTYRITIINAARCIPSTSVHSCYSLRYPKVSSSGYIRYIFLLYPSPSWIWAHRQPCHSRHSWHHPQVNPFSDVVCYLRPATAMLLLKQATEYSTVCTVQGTTYQPIQPSTTVVMVSIARTCWMRTGGRAEICKMWLHLPGDPDGASHQSHRRLLPVSPSSQVPQLQSPCLCAPASGVSTQTPNTP